MRKWTISLILAVALALFGFLPLDSQQRLPLRPQGDYAEFSIYNDGTDFPINTSAIWHLWFDAGTTAGGLDGFTFSAGTAAAATAWAPWPLTTVDTESLLGQKVLSVTATTGFTAGDNIIIDEGGANQEAATVDTIQAGVSLTLVGDLTITHAIGETVGNTGKVEATTAAPHGLLTGDVVSITGTTNYNGLFMVTKVDADEFYIADTWVVDDAAGAIDRGDQLIVSTANAGLYEASFLATAASAVGVQSIAFCFFKNLTAQAVSFREVYCAGSDLVVLSGSAFLQLIPGDVISLGIQSTTGSDDINVKHMSVSLRRI